MPATVNAIYNRYSDNLAPSATITVQTGTAATGYTATQIADGNIAKPSKLNETSGAWLFDFGSAKQIMIAAIGHHNFAAGLNVRIQANATNAWGAPSLDVPFTIPAWRVDRFPAQPWLDLSAVAGAGAYRYWRFVVVGVNPVAIAVGALWLGNIIRRLSPNYVWGDVVGYDQPQVEKKTAYRRLRNSLGTTVRSITADLNPATNAGAQDVVDWFLDANGRAILLILDGTLNEVWFALNTVTVQQVKQTFIDFNTIHLAFEEDGRGLEPTPSPL